MSNQSSGTWKATALIAVLIGVGLWRPLGWAAAHETDQYSVPRGQELADLGDLWNRMMHEAVRKSVEDTNAEIDAALDIPIAEVRSLRLASLQSPDHVALKVRWQFPVGLLLIDDFERTLRREEAKTKYQGKLLLYRAEGDEAVYAHGPLLPDPRFLGRIDPVRASTIRVHGCYFGSDKLGHFIGWGHLYYLQYRLSRGLGASGRKSLSDSTKVGNLNPIGEIFLHGFLPTGVYSNADLAANYVGLKFYINLGESVRLKGEVCPPMLEREGEHWKLAEHVRPEGRYFSMFISDHFDEALNPCLYDWTLRPSVRENVRGKRESLVNWYADGHPSRATRRWFDEQWLGLRTYYGEDFGRFGDYEDLVTIGNSCFPDEPMAADLRARVKAAPTEAVADAARPSAWARTVAARNKLIEKRSPIASDAFRDVRIEARIAGAETSGLQESHDFAVAIVNIGEAAARDLEIRLIAPSGLLPTTLESTADYDPETRTTLWRIPRLAAGDIQHLRYKASTVEAGLQRQAVSVREDKVLLAEGALATQIESSLE